MSTAASKRLASPRAAATTWATIAVVFVLAVVAWTIARAGSTEQIARNGQTAVAAESVLGANDVVAKAIGQVVLLAEDNSLGVADDAVLQRAIDEGRRAIGDLVERVALLEDEALTENTGLAALEAGAVVDLAASGEVRQASTHLVESAVPALARVRDRSAQIRGQASDTLVAATSRSANAGRVAAFLAAFLIPVGAIFVYRAAARRQLRVAEARLDERLAAEKVLVRSKDDFIAGISHELRTPLTTIHGLSEILLEDDSTPDRDLLELINKESAELARMVEDLIVSARAAETSMAYDIGPVDVARETALVVEPLVRLGALIDVHIPPVLVIADRLRFRQIVRNLAVNAVNHGGQHVRISAAATDGVFRCVVTDDGSGVPEEQVPRLFTRFVHEGNDPLTTGSIGLGLAVVKLLVRDMGGDVRYERCEGRTEFSFTLPAAAVQPGTTTADELTAAT